MTISKSISIYKVSKKSQNSVLGILALLSVFFLWMIFKNQPNVAGIVSFSHFELSFNKLSVFVGSIFCVSLFLGLFPIRQENDIEGSFLYYILGGLGIILSNNLLTFFVFWSLQRSLPCLQFIRNIRQEQSITGGTFLLQHLLTFGCLVGLLVLAANSGYASMSFSQIPASFFSWPVLLLTWVIIYESLGIFPFHSWIHDMVGVLSWYQISGIFLSRAGVLLFVKFLLPSLNQDPDIFRILLLALSITSSIYWTVRGIYEISVTRATTFFYVAQASLILTGLQAGAVAERGAYLHLMIISLSGTALWSLVSHVQRAYSIKRLNQFYGLAQCYPRLATIFCLFGLSMIGTPLGASFVVEDLVITGLLEKEPYLGLGHILATCLNGILFFLVFSKLFLGQSSYPMKVKNLDMGLAQMVPYILALTLMILIGIYPSLFLEYLQW